MWGVSIPQKLCSGEKDGDENVLMIRKFFKYASKSKTIGKCTVSAPREQIFDVSSVLFLLSQSKKLDIHNLVLMENVTRCLETIRMFSIVNCELEDLRKENFDMYNEGHMKMLDNFWKNMKGSDREVAGIISTEWTSLGFQGSDPTTDFRSMGVLGLTQLHFIAKTKPDVAKLIHREFTSSGHNFPFAIIGINLSRLVLEMFGQRRLHEYMIQRFGNLTVNCTLAYLEGPSNDRDCIDYCLSLVHEVYCLAYEEFYTVWKIRKPRSIMAFTELYNEVQAVMHEKYPPII
jgi:hypothetical protein